MDSSGVRACGSLAVGADDQLFDEGEEQVFISGCKEGLIGRLRPCLKRVSGGTLDLGFRHAAWRGHPHIVSFLMGRVSQDTVETVFLGDRPLNAKVSNVFLSSLQDDFKCGRFLRACAEGNGLVVQRIAMGELQRDVLLKGIGDALSLGHYGIVVQLFDVLDFGDQQDIFRKVLDLDQLGLVQRLAVKIQDVQYLGRVFASECSKGCLANVETLESYIYYDFFQKGFRAAVRRQRYEVVDYLARSHMLGPVFIKNELLEACLQGVPVELVVCLFRHLHYLDDRKDVFSEACANNRLDIVEGLLKLLSAKEQNIFVEEGFRRAVLSEESSLDVVRFLKDKVFWSGIARVFGELCIDSDCLDTFKYVLEALLSDPARVEYSEYAGQIPQWRQEVIEKGVREAMKAMAVDKVNLLAPHVIEQWLLDKMFEFAFDMRDVKLFEYLITRVSRRAYNVVKNSFVRDNVCGNEEYLADVDEPAIADEIAEGIEYWKMRQIMKENPRG